MLSGAIPIENTMSTNLTRDLDATPSPEHLAQTVTARDSLYPVAFKYAEQTGFDLETDDDDGSYNLRRWFGPDNSPLCLTLFAGISLPAVITICDSIDLDDWDKLHGLMGKLGPLDPRACEPAESSTTPGAPVPNKSNNDPDLVITDLFRLFAVFCG